MYVADDKRYDSMQYRRSGRSGIKLPAVSLGLWHNFGGVDNFENARASMAKREVNERWQREMRDFFVQPDGALPDRAMQSLEEVFHL